MKVISETIDGSIKDIIQLKTVDNSLEYSQMFDALEDCPDGFKSKLIGALNSLGETMGTDPCDAFNKVLCASEDDDGNVKKKLYNWWRGVFEVVANSADSIPEDRVGEYEEKVDALVAEICRSGDKARDNNETVLEDGTEPVNEMWDSLKYGSRQLTPKEKKTKPKYKKGDILYSTYGDRCRVVGSPKWDRFHGWEYEVWVMDGGNAITCHDEDKLSPKKPSYESYEPADLEDEDRLKESMKFAISKLGEVAKKAQELVDFLNPWVQSHVNEALNPTPEALDAFNKVVSGIEAEAERLLSMYMECARDYIYERLAKRGGKWGGNIASDNMRRIQGDATRIWNGFTDVVDWMRLQDMPERKGVDWDTWVDARKRLEALYERGRKIRDGFARGFKGISSMEEFDSMYGKLNEDNGTMDMMNERDGSEWISMDDIVGMEVGESDDGSQFWKAMDDVDDLERRGYWSGEFKVGDKVTWIDPDGDEIKPGYEVVEAPEPDDDGEIPGDGIYVIVRDDGSEAEVYGNELRPTSMDESDDGASPMNEDEFLDAMMDEAENTDDVFEIYSGSVVDDGYVALNVKVNKENTSKEEVRDEFKDVSAKYGWEYESFEYSSELPDEENTVNIIVYFRSIGKNVAESLGTPATDPEDMDKLDMRKNEREFIDGMMKKGTDPDSTLEITRWVHWGDDGILFGCIYMRNPDDVYTEPDSIKFTVKEKMASMLKGSGWKARSYRWPDEDDLMLSWNARTEPCVPFNVVCERERTRMDEANVVVDANTVWDVLDLLDDEIANKNLTDLINSHLRTEDEIMDAIDSYVERYWSGKIAKQGLVGIFTKYMYEIVDSLGLDVERFKQDGQFVEPEKPVTLEGSDGEQKPDEVKDGDKKYKQDGETKTLVTGSEGKVVSEMTIEQEVNDPWKLLNLLWGQGRDNFQELLHANLFSDDTIMGTLEQFEIRELGNLNDFLAFEFEEFLEALGCDRDAWVQNLEITRGGSEEVDEAKKDEPTDPMVKKIEDAIPVDDRDGLMEIRYDRWGSYVAQYAPGSEPEIKDAIHALAKVFPDYHVGYDNSGIVLLPKKHV